MQDEPIRRLDASLDVVKPHLPSLLVSEESFARIRLVASLLPVFAVDFFGFECRLGAETDSSDCALNLTPDGARMLAGQHTITAPQELQNGSWDKLRSFYRAWGETRSEPFEDARATWLEFDTSAGGREVSAPNLLFGYWPQEPQRPTRCEAYRCALAKWVSASDVVLDVGAGTGILSLFAVQSGARKVYAVERTSIVNLTRQLIETNVGAERVHVIHGDMESVELPEQVDIIVSEWMGGCGVDEGFLPAVLLARDRWLKPGGRMLPERVTAWAAPVRDSQLEADLSFWRSRPYDVDLSLIAGMSANEVRYCQHHVTADTLMAEPQPMWITDVYTCSVEEARAPFKASLSFPVTCEGNFNALATWFHAEFGQGVALTNSPDAPKTHWGRFIYPLDGARNVERGTEVSVEFACVPTVDSHCLSKWSARVGEGVWEHHQSIN